MTVRPGRSDLLTDVAGLRVGHAMDETIRTGTTVVLPDDPVVMAADVRGGGPGTRETDLLDPSRPIGEFHGVALSGGSVFGLDAASGVVDWLSSRGVGLADRGPRRLPLVPSAILFDLRNGGDKEWGDVSPYRRLGIEACEAATTEFAVGRVGAGYGAMAGDVPGGIGSASAVTDGYTIAALVVVNSFGVVGTPPDGPSPVPMPKLPRTGENTTLAVVATDLALTKAEAKRIATMAHDGMARTIRPIHTPFDGDTVFVMATGRVAPGGEPSITLAEAGTLAADCVAAGILRAVSR